MQWVDCLDNISIGGLLSEASLLGKFDSKLFGSNATSQTGHLISDSLDAFINCRINPPVSTQSVGALRTSILDAEETCHAFALKKLSSSADVQTTSATETAYAAACGQNASSNLFKIPCTEKVNDQVGLSQNPPSQKTQTDLMLSSRLFDDERSLGLTGINWIASLAIRSGNGLLLKGGKEAKRSNAILHKVITEAIPDTVGSKLIGLVTSRAEIPELLKLDDVIDLVIPRGINKLVSDIKSSTKIPVLESCCNGWSPWILVMESASCRCKVTVWRHRWSWSFRHGTIRER